MHDDEKLQQLLKKLSTFPIFEGTQGYQLEQVLKSAMILNYTSGSIIYDRDDLSTGFFIILTGAVRIQIHKLKSLELGPGRYFGEYSLIENRSHNGKAITLTDSEILVIPSDVFNNLLQQSLPFSNNLLKTLVKRLKSKERLEHVLIEKNMMINEQNEQIVEQNRKITDSMEYAGVIQKALLPPEKLFKLKFNSCFLFFRPYENVSGDFFWFAQRYNEYCVVVADCTGHGVPAGLISILGITHLNEIMHSMQDPDPGKILTILNKKISGAFTDNQERYQTNEGMDIAFITINFETMTLRYAGANNPVYLVRNREINELQPIKSALGNQHKKFDFTTTKVHLENKDMIYLFTDGIVDQIGGTKGRRLGFSQFKTLITNTSDLNVYNQQQVIIDYLDNWCGEYPQIDDITLLGIQI